MLGDPAPGFGLAALILAVVALALHSGAAQPGDGVAPSVVVLALAACASLVAALAYCRPRRDSAAAGFALLYMKAASPAALTDGEGRILAANAAFGAGAMRGRPVGAVIGARLGDRAGGDALAYRLANRALRRDVALERWPLDGGVVAIKAARAGAKEAPRLIWTMIGMEELSAEIHRGAPYGFLRHEPGGAHLSANEAFAAMADDARAAVIAAADAARAGGRAHGVAVSGAGRFVFAATSAFGGREERGSVDAGRAPA
ncbi:MAG: hypothetical protein ACK5MQ_11680, partial [Pikeienuella sp.]